MRTRVLIADDHELVSKGIERILENEFDVVGVVSDGRELLAEASRSQPDVIILDIAMPLLNGIEAASRLHNSLPTTKLLFAPFYAHRTCRTIGEAATENDRNRVFATEACCGFKQHIARMTWPIRSVKTSHPQSSPSVDSCGPARHGEINHPIG
jgi:CheY-like chemotaxis protein